MAHIDICKRLTLQELIEQRFVAEGEGFGERVIGENPLRECGGCRRRCSICGCSLSSHRLSVCDCSLSGHRSCIRRGDFSSYRRIRQITFRISGSRKFQGIPAQLLADLIKYLLPLLAVETDALHLIHLVYKNHDRNIIVLEQLPQCPHLSVHAVRRADDQHREVEDLQRALHLRREIRVARRVEKHICALISLRRLRGELGLL